MNSQFQILRSRVKYVQLQNMRRTFQNTFHYCARLHLFVAMVQSRWYTTRQKISWRAAKSIKKEANHNYILSTVFLSVFVNCKATLPLRRILVSSLPQFIQQIKIRVMLRWRTARRSVLSIVKSDTKMGSRKPVFNNNEKKQIIG